MQWLVAEGDTVTLNQTIAEVETAKAVVELPSPYAGIVSALHAAAGDVVEVGSVLISFDIAVQEAEAPAARGDSGRGRHRGSRTHRKRRRSRTSSATEPRRAARVARSGGPAAAPDRRSASTPQCSRPPPTM